MTDYNDGKWHGWNGGVCPVSHSTIVDVVSQSGLRSFGDEAWRIEWDVFRGAFRVAKPTPPKPREWWLLVGADGSVRSASTARINACGCHDKIIHVREVLE